jgi:hypothetical protein
VRSIAWHWVFSSKLKTTARLGGFMHSPTTSTSLASNCGSLEILNVLTLHGLRLWSVQTLAMVSLPSPNRQRAGGPVRPAVVRLVLAGHPNDLGDRSLGQRGLAAPAFGDLPTPSTPYSANRARPPSDRFSLDLAAPGNLLIRHAVTRPQQRLGLHHLPVRNDEDAAIRVNSARCVDVNDKAGVVIQEWAL